MPERVAPKPEKQSKGDKMVIAPKLASFLSQLLDSIPGGELGQNIAEFSGFLRVAGLDKVVSFEKGKILLHEDKLVNSNLPTIMEKILKYMEGYESSAALTDSLAELFLEVYNGSRLKSIQDSDRWLIKLLNDYGGSLSAYGVLDNLPPNSKLPSIFKLLQLGSVRYFKEEQPTRAYAILKEAISSGFSVACVSNLEFTQVEEKYKIKNPNVISLTFGKKGSMFLPPNKLNTLGDMISKLNPGSVILLDCFKEIKVVNGFERALAFLREIKDLVKENRFALLVTMDPRDFNAVQLSMLERELGGVEL